MLQSGACGLYNYPAKAVLLGGRLARRPRPTGGSVDPCPGHDKVSPWGSCPAQSFQLLVALLIGATSSATNSAIGSATNSATSSATNSAIDKIALLKALSIALSKALSR